MPKVKKITLEQYSMHKIASRTNNLIFRQKLIKYDSQVSKSKVTIPELHNRWIKVLKGISGVSSYQPIGEIQGVPKMPSV